MEIREYTLLPPSMELSEEIWGKYEGMFIYEVFIFWAGADNNPRTFYSRHKYVVNMKEYVENMEKYVENMKKYVGNMKKYLENMIFLRK